MGKVILTLISIAAAVAAVVLLVEFADAEFDRVGAHLLQVGPGALGLACLASFVQVAISAYKWCIVLSVMASEQTRVPGARLSLVLASLTAVVAQVLPLYVAAPALRSAVARYALGTPVIEGALASAVEQAFDVMAFSLFLVPTLVIFGFVVAGFEPGFTTWIVAAALVLMAAFAFLGSALSGVGGTLGGVLWLRGASATWSRAFSAIDAPLQRRLLMLSLIRYGAILSRVVVVIVAAGFAIPLVHVVYGHSVVQAAQLAAVTPGNLGLAEWTWVGALGYLGHDLATIAVFSLTLRVVSVASYVLVSSAVLICITGPLLWKRSGRGG
jgi:uncharacterized membrane protein YbhN (UPF0104 family)